MDTPRHHLRAFAGIQMPAGAHGVVRPRQGLADQSSFVRAVENEADVAQDQSKLNYDFGAAAVSPRTNRVIAEIHEQESVQKKERNPLVDAAAMYANENVAVAPKNWKPLAKSAGNPYERWLK